MSLIDGFLGPILVETMEKKKVFPPSFTHSRSREGNQEEEEEGNGRSVPVDIAESQQEYVFYFDVPGLSKSDIQVTLEEKNVLVVKGGGKRKREEEEEEVSEEEERKGCKYLRMERNAYTRFMRKFRLPVDADLSAISARCDNGVLTVSVEKAPPVAKSKTVEITIS
ncbi:18.6 kDa class III heat shock protein [Acorus gramineus]|uniref:18.6 kDa class III heat shock protein n=1 Tax=Acorus gramineus TaxID=55184 RepID=A0AAV9AFJ9_ACOGR|nr:18.6 kDa class III heat shock protein [Acorus gramineus]